jgi:hypothetical protein
MRDRLVKEIENNGKQTHIARVLMPMIRAAEGKTENILKDIETWYKDAESQMTAWYRRHNQRMVALIAIVACCLLNVDTILMINTLSTNADMRTMLIAAATATVEKVGDDFDKSKLIETLNTEAKELAFPIGWTLRGDDEPVDTPQDPRGFPTRCLGWLKKLLGLSLSVVAVSLGAPFWFDLLKKILAIRKGGKSSDSDDDESRTVNVVVSNKKP